LSCGEIGIRRRTVECGRLLINNNTLTKNQSIDCTQWVDERNVGPPYSVTHTRARARARKSTNLRFSDVIPGNAVNKLLLFFGLRQPRRRRMWNEPRKIFPRSRIHIYFVSIHTQIPIVQHPRHRGRGRGGRGGGYIPCAINIRSRCVRVCLCNIYYMNGSAAVYQWELLLYIVSAKKESGRVWKRIPSSKIINTIIVVGSVCVCVFFVLNL